MAPLHCTYRPTKATNPYRHGCNRFLLSRLHSTSVLAFVCAPNCSSPFTSLHKYAQSVHVKSTWTAYRLCAWVAHDIYKRLIHSSMPTGLVLFFWKVSTWVFVCFFCAVRRRMHYIPATSAMIMLSRCISYALMLSFVYVYVPVQVEEESQEIKP